MVRRAVVADQTRAVHEEPDRQILDANIVQNLIEAALEEGRINRAKRPHSARSEPRCEGHRVLLGDTRIVIALRNLLLEARQARAVGHGRRDCHDLRIGLCDLDRDVAKRLRVRHRAGGFHQLMGLQIERRDAVPLAAVLLGDLVALPLDRDRMNEDWPG